MPIHLYAYLTLTPKMIVHIGRVLRSAYKLNCNDQVAKGSLIEIMLAEDWHPPAAVKLMGMQVAFATKLPGI